MGIAQQQHVHCNPTGFVIMIAAQKGLADLGPCPPGSQSIARTSYQHLAHCHMHNWGNCFRMHMPSCAHTRFRPRNAREQGASCVTLHGDTQIAFQGPDGSVDFAFDKVRLMFMFELLICPLRCGAMRAHVHVVMAWMMGHVGGSLGCIWGLGSIHSIASWGLQPGWCSHACARCTDMHTDMSSCAMQVACDLPPTSQLAFRGPCPFMSSHLSACAQACPVSCHSEPPCRPLTKSR